jgi:hypothetical protein
MNTGKDQLELTLDDPHSQVTRRQAISFGLAGTAAILLSACESLAAPREPDHEMGPQGAATLQSRTACQECVQACAATFEACRTRARQKNCGTDPAEQAKCALQVLQETQQCYAQFLNCLERCGDTRKMLRCINRANEKLFRFMLVDVRRAVERIDDCVRRETVPSRAIDCIYLVFVQLAEDIDSSILGVSLQLREQCCEESGT